jgi:hypothetical protein
MKKYISLAILLLIFMIKGSTQAQTVGVRIPDTTVVSGTNINIPIYVNASLTGKGVLSYSFQVTYDQNYFLPLSIITSATISAQFSNPTLNTSVPGKITFASAGTIPLTGIGVFLYMRFTASNAGSFDLSFTGEQNNYFNEGNPAVNLVNGHINISAPPAITITPDNAIMSKGESLQFNASGGNSNYNWYVTNPLVAAINGSGLLTASLQGYTKVVAEDIDGLRDTSGTIDIRAMRLSIPDNLSQYQGGYINVPVNTTDLTGLNLYSGNIKLSFDEDILTPVSVITSGTILSSYPTPVVNTNTPGAISIAFAGITPLSGSGVLLYIRFHVTSQNSGGDWINFVSSILDQTYVPCFTDGYFTVINLPTLTVVPNTGTLIAGETQQLAISGNGTPPYIWNVSDSLVASVSQSGLLTAHKSGTVVITAHDAMGAHATSGNFQIYDTKIIMPDTTICPPPVFSYPVFVQSMPAGESVFSIQAKLNFDPSFLTFIDIESAGTLTQDWTYVKNQSSGQVIFAGSGSASFNTAGELLKINFHINPSMPTGSDSHLTLTDVVLDEGSPLPLVENNGYIRLDLSPPATPGAIAGLAVVSQGQAGIIYSTSGAPGATSYLWTVPTGWTITAGQGTTAITVTSGSAGQDGNIQVTAGNDCGDSQQTLAVNVLAYTTLHLTNVMLEELYRNNNTMIKVRDAVGPHWSDSIADHIKVELHNAGAYSTIVYTATDVPLSIAGNATVNVPAIYNGSYYITVRHRSSVETTTAAPVSFTGSAISQSFGLPANVYGGNLKAAGNGHYLIYGGDVNQDRVVDTGDFIPIDNDSYNYVVGYVVSDVNGDGQVDTSDFIIVDNNSYNFVNAKLP